jgi:hypothetical protein
LGAFTKNLAAAACAHAERVGGVGVVGVVGGVGGGGGGGGGGLSTDVWRWYDVMVCTPLRLVSLLPTAR